MKFATKYCRISVHPKLKCGKSLTDQSFRSECSIDRILYKYTHHLPLEDWQMRHTLGSYSDVTQVPKDPSEYSDWVNMVQSRFAELPAELRREYADDAFRFASALAVDSDDLAKRLDKLLVDNQRRLNPTLADINENLAKLAVARSSMPTQSSQISDDTNQSPENKE